MNRATILFWVISFIAAIIILACDSVLPRGIAAGEFNVLLVLLSLITQRKRDAIIMAMIGSLSTVIGALISPASEVSYTIVMANRSIALVMIWLVCMVLIKHFSTLSALKNMATLDQITELNNRHHFFSKAEKILKSWARYKMPVSLVLIDLDDFKSINDTYGHDIGDQVLKQVAITLKQCLRDVDEIARIGGEEFAALLPSTAIDSAYVVAEKVRLAIEMLKINYQNHEIKVTVSIGVTTASNDQNNISDLLKAADKLLYQAKRVGKNYTAVEADALFKHIGRNLKFG